MTIRLSSEIRDHRIRPLPTRFEQHRFRAIVLGWLIDAVGETKAEALSALDQELVRRRRMRIESGEGAPRPGTRVPLGFASQTRVDEHASLTDEFVSRVLKPVLGIEDVWISDESSLWNFHFEENNDALNKKISEVYGVDVSDIESGNVAEILERIAMTQKTERS